MAEDVKLSDLVPGLRRKLDDMPFMNLARPKNEGEPYYEDPHDDPLFVKATERFVFGYHDWRGVFGTQEAKIAKVGYTITRETLGGVFQAAKPHLWIPAGIAATVIKNPVVTRRFWAGWGK